MSEILFIATDPCILALVENLQQLVEPRIWVESDYTSGIKRIFDTRPAVVFLQHKIGAVACDKLANQVKMLLDGEPVPMVLLSEDSVTSYSVISTYEACFDICLPLEELSLLIQRLLRTMPEISWKESLQQLPGTPSEAAQDKPDAFLPEAAQEKPGTLPFQAALEKPGTLPFQAAQENPGALSFQAAQEKPGALPPELTMEISLPAGAADLAPFPWLEATAETATQFTSFGGATLEAFESNDVAGSELFGTAGQQEPQFLSDFLEDRFVISPLPLDLGGADHQEAAAGYPAAPHQDAAAVYPAAPLQDSRSDLRRLERADPRQVFESHPEPREEPTFVAPRPIGPRPTPKDAVATLKTPAAPPAKNIEKATPAAPRQTPLTESQTRPAAASLPDELPESVAAILGIKKERSGFFRLLAFGMLLIISIASLDLLLTLHRGARPAPPRTDKPQGTPAPQAASRPAAQQLPQFIPQVAPDSSYPASHPGWERYQADGVEYLVCREKGSIAAVQVLSQQPGAISPPFLKTCLRLSAGAEQFSIKKTEERSGIQITTGTLQDGSELAVYRAVPAGEIRGFVIAFPNSGQPSQKGAQK
jgi:hypothetical protein